MAFQTVVFLFIAILVDYYQCHSFKGNDQMKQTKERVQLQEMQDVLDHKKFTETMWDKNDGTHLIKCKDIKKVYMDGVAAVNNNTFCVKKGSVFGLLGPNGAGKSSMFNIMTMDMKRTEGQIKVMDINIDEMQVNEHGNKMGICPQANTIWNALTVDQSLKFIG